MSRWITAAFCLVIVIGCKQSAPVFASTTNSLPPTPYYLPPINWTLTAVGDIMLDRNVWLYIKKNGADYPFKKITSTLKGADIVLANLEGPFTNSTRHAISGGSLTFTFDPSTAPALKRVGLTTLSLANNHTLNQGQAGLNNTRAVLKKTGLEYFGDPSNRTNFTLTKTINGQKVAFIGYHGLVGGIENVVAEIRRAHASGAYVIVVPHEGTEYRLTFSPKQQQDYRAFTNAGADLILGSHPHVVEPLEIYKGKLIVYSLGNFVFDQYFSADTQQELMVKLAFNSSSITVNLIPLVSVRSQVSVASNSVKTKLLNRIADNSSVSSSIRSAIRGGVFVIPK